MNWWVLVILGMFVLGWVLASIQRRERNKIIARIVDKDKK